MEQNDNLFQQLFGIKFSHEGSIFVGPFLQFKVEWFFSLSKDLTHRLSQPNCHVKLEHGIPAHTSAWLFDQVVDKLIEIHNANYKVFNPVNYTAPAAVVQAFISFAMGTHLPSIDFWKAAYTSNPEMTMIMRIINKPSLATKENLLKVDANYIAPLRQARMTLKCNMIILNESLGMTPSSYVKLGVVPEELCEIIFIAFHANPVGGHLHPYRTYSRMWLRYFWPGMFTFCKRMCKSCPGCTLAN
jgi:hypothetical protein